MALEKRKSTRYEIPGLPKTVADFMSRSIGLDYAGPEAFPLGSVRPDRNRQTYLENKGWQFVWGEVFQRAIIVAENISTKKAFLFFGSQFRDISRKSS